MYKPSLNPKVEELTKSHRDRSINLELLRAIKTEDGKKMCAWCAQGQLHHGNQKYCTDNCRDSATAWAYPQKEEALYFLLQRQGWKCNLCSHAYPEPTTPSKWYTMKRLKRASLPERKPEVDHIVPVYKGGTSIGLDNHQAICYTCHKAKTRIDNSGKRAKI